MIEKTRERGFLSRNVKSDLGQVESRLKGNTLRLYWYLVKTGRPVTIHEAQKELNLSSPGLVSYHLNKLVDLGLVDKTRGEYEPLEEVKVGVLRYFVRLYGFMVPRYVFYAVFFTALFIIFTFFFANPLNIYSWFASTVCLASAVIFWYETVRIWRGRPF